MFSPVRTVLASALAIVLASPISQAGSPAPLFLTAASDQAPTHIAETWLRQAGGEHFGLDEADLDFTLGQDSYVSDHTGVTHVFLQQHVNQIPVYRAQTQINVLPDGRILNATSSFEAHAITRANAPTPALSAADSIRAAARDLGLDNFQPEARASQPGDDDQPTFAGSVLSAEDIRPRLVYAPWQGQLRLAWQFMLDRFDRDSRLLDVRYDAQTGVLLDSDDYVEQFDAKQPGRAEAASKAAGHNVEYRVIPLGQESPIHAGPGHSLVRNPHRENASPFGWHDTRNNPRTGQPEYLVTRGNNVRAQWDLYAGNVNADSYRPLGVWDASTLTLSFDFPWDPDAAPDGTVNRLPATVNLFYWNNIIHDVMYQYGFNEPAGNFQFNNYQRGGAQNDGVIADALDGSMANPASTNNANFSTPVDGGSGRMQMFRWTSPGGVQVTSPFAETYTSPVPSDWGGAFATPISGQIVPVQSSSSGGEGCEGPYVNATDVAGNIALVQRGSCEFGVKALVAQQNGAIGVIIYNNGGDPGGMAGGASGAAVTIPTMGLMTTEDGTALAQAAATDAVYATMSRQLYADRDSDFDAAIMVHEYGHGISYRLTGGPNSNCLSGNEQQGEGWSDYFALMLTMTDAVCEAPRGIGNYANFDPVDGLGIRAYPYSPDMSINPFTYNSIATQAVPHGVGSVWATMLWDMSCKLMDRYGYEPDVYSRGGGNGMALQLVVDGEKLQGCYPQFVKSRDGILAADAALAAVTDTDYLSNRCIIWHSFARRGVGKNASAGSYNSNTDQTEDYTVPAECESFTVDVQASVGGSVIPVTSTTAAYEDVLSFDILPDPGFHVRSISDCEGDLVDTTFVTLPMVRDCILDVQFSDSVDIFSDDFEAD